MLRAAFSDRRRFRVYEADFFVQPFVLLRFKKRLLLRSFMKEQDQTNQPQEKKKRAAKPNFGLFLGNNGAAAGKPQGGAAPNPNRQPQERLAETRAGKIREATAETGTTAAMRTPLYSTAAETNPRRENRRTRPRRNRKTCRARKRAQGRAAASRNASAIPSRSCF